eukprot:scaffold229363_cov38-Prasinocladus_malaysianus.AAC.1
MVVSEIAVAWSPNTAPASTPETTRTKMFSSPPELIQDAGTTSGNMMDIVPQDVPVQKEMRAAMRNVKVGSMRGSRLSWDKALAKKRSHETSCTAWPMPQAMISTSTGVVRPLMPSIHTARDSLKLAAVVILEPDKEPAADAADEGTPEQRAVGIAVAKDVASCDFHAVCQSVVVSREHERQEDHYEELGRVLSGLEARVQGHLALLGVGGVHLLLVSGSALCLEHRAGVTLEDDERQLEHQHEDGVEPADDRLEEHGVAARNAGSGQLLAVPHVGEDADLLVDESDFEANPGRYRCDGRDGRCGGVDDERQLLAADEEGVADAAHRGPQDERVGVVVEEDDEAEDEHGELQAPSAGYPRDDRVGYPVPTTALLHDGHEPGEEPREEDDVGMVDVSEGVHHVVVQGAQEGVEHVALGDDRAGHKQACVERPQDVLADHRDDDDEEGRQDGDATRDDPRGVDLRRRLCKVWRVGELHDEVLVALVGHDEVEYPDGRDQVPVGKRLVVRGGDHVAVLRDPRVDRRDVGQVLGGGVAQ